MKLLRDFLVGFGALLLVLAVAAVFRFWPWLMRWAFFAALLPFLVYGLAVVGECIVCEFEYWRSRE